MLAFPDEKKGERIVLVTEKSAAERKPLLAEAKARDITELAVPKTIVYLEEIPTMSSGKIDYVRLHRIISACTSSDLI